MGMLFRVPVLRLLRWIGADEFDHVAVGIADDGEGQGRVDIGGQGCRAFGDGFDAGFFQALQGGIGAFDDDGEVAESELAVDVGVVRLFAAGVFDLHQLELGGAFALAEDEHFDVEHLAFGQANFFWKVSGDSESGDLREADSLGVEFNGGVDVANDATDVDGLAEEFLFGCADGSDGGGEEKGGDQGKGVFHSVGILGKRAMKLKVVSSTSSHERRLLKCGE